MRACSLYSTNETVASQKHETTIRCLYVILAVVVGAWRIRATKTTVVGLT